MSSLLVSADLGLDQPVEAALVIEFDVGAIQFGEVRQLEHLGCAMVCVYAQPVRRAVDQPLRAEVTVVHEHLRSHHRNGQQLGLDKPAKSNKGGAGQSTQHWPYTPSVR